ncbi:MAG: HAMP domain-containing protein, partial [Gammaproteobacteria bacterium]
MQTSSSLQPLKSKLFWQIWAAVNVVFFITMSLSTVILTGQIRQSGLASLEKSLEQRLMLLHGQIEKQLMDRSSQSIVELSDLVDSFDSNNRQHQVTLILPDGSVVANTESAQTAVGNQLRLPEIAVIRAGRTELGSSRRFSNRTNQEMLYLATKLTVADQTMGFIRISQPLTVVENRVSTARQTLVLATLALFTGSFFVGWLFARSISTPIGEIQRVSVLIAEGGLDLRVPAHRYDEFGALAMAFNRMADTVERRVEDLTLSRNQLEAILGGLEEGVVAIDRMQRIIHVNSVARSLLSLESDNLIKTNLMHLPISLPLRELVDTFFKEASNQSRTIKLSGNTVAATVLGTGSPSFEGAIIVLQDITEVRRLERARTDFVANASHELKTPIAA